MKLSNKFSVAAFSLMVILAVGAVAGFANFKTVSGARPEIKLELAGTVMRGGKDIAISEAGKVNSGEVIDWTIRSVNTGKADAVSHEAIGRIPSGTSYVAGSAKSEADAVVSFSTDGGKTFSKTPTVSIRAQDGSMKQVPAPVSSYTQIKYSWDSALAPTNARTAAYEVSVK
jgi:uncharacterized repeat protein (TIGR01451 family)